ncbi:hypothetical protein WJX73_007293 [Symbiochloris irregularis]|uniref:Uncharacterized protein n=1 Tax=Symbiochloris irregularis TaxID=706552 RepID=A0AAW1PMN6_9CHLO
MAGPSRPVCTLPALPRKEASKQVKAGPDSPTYTAGGSLVLSVVLALVLGSNKVQEQEKTLKEMDKTLHIFKALCEEFKILAQQSVWSCRLQLNGRENLHDTLIKRLESRHQLKLDKLQKHYALDLQAQVQQQTASLDSLQEQVKILQSHPTCSRCLDTTAKAESVLRECEQMQTDQLRCLGHVLQINHGGMSMTSCIEFCEDLKKDGSEFSQRVCREPGACAIGFHKFIGDRHSPGGMAGPSRPKLRVPSLPPTYRQTRLPDGPKGEANLPPNTTGGSLIISVALAFVLGAPKLLEDQKALEKLARTELLLNEYREQVDLQAVRLQQLQAQVDKKVPRKQQRLFEEITALKAERVRMQNKFDTVQKKLAEDQLRTGNTEKRALALQSAVQDLNRTRLRDLEKQQALMANLSRSHEQLQEASLLVVQETACAAQEMQADHLKYLERVLKLQHRGMNMTDFQQLCESLVQDQGEFSVRLRETVLSKMKTCQACERVGMWRKSVHVVHMVPRLAYLASQASASWTLNASAS